MRGKYGSLGCLVELYGAGHLLDIQPQLPSCLLGLMGDQTLAPYASDLLERLFVSHKAQLASEAGAADKTATEDWMEQWHQTWVTPLLQVLCRAKLDQTTYILDYFLPKLLRCSPSSVAHMVQALQDTPPCSTGKYADAHKHIDIPHICNYFLTFLLVIVIVGQLHVNVLSFFKTIMSV